jgi:outer membrane protein assembly factor BamB
MRKSFLVCLIVSCLLSDQSIAQSKANSAWSAKFTSPVNWQRVHSLGYLIVSTNDGLYGVAPATGAIVWQNKSFPGLDPANFQEVEGTEFVTIARKNDPDSKILLQAIMEVTAGKVLFDSQTEQIGVLSRHVLASSGKLLVIGVKQGTGESLSGTLFMYDIASGKQLWTNDELFKPQESGKKGFMATLEKMGAALGSLQALTSEPVELPDQTMIITHPMFVFRINSADGKVLWKAPLKPSTKAKVVFSPYQPDVVYIGTEVESSSGSGFSSSSGSKPAEPNKFYENIYYAFNLSTGQPVWTETPKEKDKLNKIIAHEKGLIICPLSSQKPLLNLIDYQSGKMQWGNKGKGIKAQGSVVNYIPTEKGILLTTAFDNAWNNKAEEYYLNVLDPASGTLKYEKSVKLKGDLVRCEIVPKGLLFITKKEINILDVGTGTLVLPNSIESGNNSITNNDKPRPFPTASKGDMIYVYSPKDQSVYEFDKINAVSRIVSKQRINFEGKELPNSVESKDEGIVLFSEQNIVMLGADGAIKYSKYYPAPREPALVRALLAAQAVRAAYIGAAASAYSAAFADAANKTTDPTGKALGKELSKGYADLGDAAFNYSGQAMKDFNARFKASRTTPNFMIMMTRQEKKGYQLIQVGKANGEIMRAVDIKNDKEPEYEVDQIYNHVYYRPNANEIVCYKLDIGG